MKLTANCPKCNTPAPSVRIPTSFHQLLWGGWTCKKCGINMDRNGEEIGMKNQIKSHKTLCSKNPFKNLSPYPTLAVTLGYLRGIEMPIIKVEDMPMVQLINKMIQL